MTSIGGNLLGKAVKIRGDITGAEDLQFDGELEGSLNLGSSKLTLGPSARVRAQITAQEVIVNGRVDGDIYASWPGAAAQGKRGAGRRVFRRHHH